MQGLLSEEQRDSFNFPYYHRSLEEVNEAVESFGDAFRVLAMKMENAGKTVNEFFPDVPDEELGIKHALLYRGGVTSLLDSYLTKTVADIFWQRFERSAQKRLSANRDRKINYSMCILSLIKM